MAVAASPAAPPASRKRFTVREDIILLQEVVAKDPLSDTDKWNDVMGGLCAASQREFTLRGTRERCDLLLGYYYQNDTASLRKCATDEQYRKKVKLLKALAAMATKCNYRPKILPRKAQPVYRASLRGKVPTPEGPGTAVPAAGTCPDFQFWEAMDAAAVNASVAGTLESGAESAKSTLFACKKSYSETASPEAAGIVAADLLMHVYVEDTEDAPVSAHSICEVAASGSRGRSPGQDVEPSSKDAAGEINLQWTPPSQRKRRQDRSGIEYIRKRFLWDVEMRQRELALETRRIALETRRLELDEMRYKLEEKKLADEREQRERDRLEREEERSRRREHLRLMLEQQELNLQMLIKEVVK